MSSDANMSDEPQGGGGGCPMGNGRHLNLDDIRGGGCPMGKEYGAGYVYTFFTPRIVANVILL